MGVSSSRKNQVLGARGVKVPPARVLHCMQSKKGWSSLNADKDETMLAKYVVHAMRIRRTALGIHLHGLPWMIICTFYF